jgi:hypothetical protein
VDIAKQYYVKFMERYRDALHGSRRRLITFNPESLAVSLMGINHMLGITSMIKVSPATESIIQEVAEAYCQGVLQEG